MNLGDITNLVENSIGNLVEKPLAAVSHIVNTPTRPAGIGRSI